MPWEESVASSPGATSASPPTPDAPVVAACGSEIPTKSSAVYLGGPDGGSYSLGDAPSPSRCVGVLPIKFCRTYSLSPMFH